MRYFKTPKTYLVDQDGQWIGIEARAAASRMRDDFVGIRKACGASGSKPPAARQFGKRFSAETAIRSGAIT